MTSEQFLDEGEYVQQLVFVQCIQELCDFFDGLFFHWQSSFHQSGAGTSVCVNVLKIFYYVTVGESNGNFALCKFTPKGVMLSRGSCRTPQKEFTSGKDDAHGDQKGWTL